MSGWVAEIAGGEVSGFSWRVASRPTRDLEFCGSVWRAAGRESAAALLGEALDGRRLSDAQQAFLEVRVSNLAALRFYERHNLK